MAKQMTVAEIEARRAEIAKEQKELAKALRNAKNREKAEAARKAREEEQAKALEFYRICKELRTNPGDAESSTIYEWVKHKTGKQDI